MYLSLKQKLLKLNRRSLVVILVAIVGTVAVINSLAAPNVNKTNVTEIGPPNIEQIASDSKYLTAGILALNHQPERNNTIEPDLKKVSDRRESKLSSLASTDPKDTRSLILPDNITASLNKHGLSSEKHVTLTGTYSQLQIDYASTDGQKPKKTAENDAIYNRLIVGKKSYILTTDERFPVVPTDSIIKVSGNLIDNQLLIDASNSPLYNFHASTNPNSSLSQAPVQVIRDPAYEDAGTLNTAVIAANFSGAQGTITPAHFSALQQEFNGSAGSDIDSYFNETSYGITKINPIFVGPLDLTSVQCPSRGASSGEVGNSNSDIFTAMINAAASQINFTGVKRIVLDSYCGQGYAGLAGSVTQISTPQGNITAGSAQIFAGYDDNETIIHELLHTMGSSGGDINGSLGHTGLLDCQPFSFIPFQSLAPAYNQCKSVEYRDVSDPLGYGGFGPAQTSTYHKVEAGWLTSTQAPMITASGTYKIAPYEKTSSSGLPLALRIPRGDGGLVFDVEYRQPIGFDSWLPNYTNQTQGATLRLEEHPYNIIQDSNGQAQYGTDSLLIDTQNPTNHLYGISYLNGALLPGKTFTDPEFGISITVVSADSTGLIVNVVYPAAKCTRALPTVSVSPSFQSLTPGNSAVYTYSITNNDSSGCTPQKFQVSNPSVTSNSFNPPDITSIISSPTFTLNPGSKQTVTETVHTKPYSLVGNLSDYDVSASVTGNYDLGGDPGNPVRVTPTATLNFNVSSTTAPSVPTGLTAKVLGSNAVQLSWNASTGSVAGYKVYDSTGNVIDDIGPNTTYLDTYVYPSTSYGLQVSAYNNNHNESAKSNSVSITTPAKSSTTPPVAPNVLSNGNGSYTVYTGPENDLALLKTDCYSNGKFAFGDHVFDTPCHYPATQNNISVDDNANKYYGQQPVYVVDTQGNYSYSDAWSQSAPFVWENSASGGSCSTNWTSVTSPFGIDHYNIYEMTNSHNNVNLFPYNPNLSQQHAIAVGYRPLILVAQTSSTSYSNCEDFAVTAVDKNGNESNYSNVESLVCSPTSCTSPKGSGTASITSPSTNSTVSGTINVNVTVANQSSTKPNVDLLLDNNPIPIGSSLSSPYNFSFDTTKIANGPHYLYALGDSSTGPILINVNNSSSNSDTTPPVVHVTSPTSGSIVSGTVNVSATATDNVAVSNVKFSVDGSQVSTVTSSPYNYSWDTTKLSNGTHVVSALATDNSGNTSSDQVSVTVANADTTPPTAPTNLTAAATSPTNVNLTWTNSTDNVGVKGYYVIRNGVTIGQSTTNSYSDTTATQGTTYTYSVQAFDAAGNTSTSSNSVTLTTPVPPPPDTTPPSVPSNVSATPTSTSQINLSWSPSTDNVGVTGYNIYDGSTFAKIATVSGTSYSSTGLTAGTTYSYYVIAFDAAGNLSNPSSTVSATTLPNTPPPDTTAPSVPPGLSATATSATQINLTWTASTDNVGVTGYTIYRNGTKLTTTNTTSYSDLGLASNTTYTYTIDAFDAAGNHSNQTSSVSATTQHIPDSTPPSQPQNLTAGAVSSTQVNLTWTASTDNIAVTNYDIYRNNTLITTIAASTSTSNGLVSWGDTTVSASTTYSYYVVAKDSSGNSSSPSTSVSVTTPGVTAVNGSVSGTVKDINSKVIGGVHITYVVNGTNHNVNTNAQGVYTVTNIVPGTYSFNYSANNYQSQSVNVTVTSGTNTVENITLHKLASITGTVSLSGVTSGAGQPGLPAIKVTYTLNNQTKSVNTNGQGKYTINGLPAGTYNLTFSTNGYVSQTKSITVANDQPAYTLNVTLSK